MNFTTIASLLVTQPTEQYLVQFLLKELSSLLCRIFATEPIGSVAFTAASLLK